MVPFLYLDTINFLNLFSNNSDMKLFRRSNLENRWPAGQDNLQGRWTYKTSAKHYSD